jgi:hypothetical protein
MQNAGKEHTRYQSNPAMPLAKLTLTSTYRNIFLFALCEMPMGVSIDKIM